MRDRLDYLTATNNDSEAEGADQTGKLLLDATLFSLLLCSTFCSSFLAFFPSLSLSPSCSSSLPLLSSPSSRLSHSFLSSSPPPAIPVSIFSSVLVYFFLTPLMKFSAYSSAFALSVGPHSNSAISCRKNELIHLRLLISTSLCSLRRSEAVASFDEILRLSGVCLEEEMRV